MTVGKFPQRWTSITFACNTLLGGCRIGSLDRPSRKTVDHRTPDVGGKWTDTRRLRAVSPAKLEGSRLPSGAPHPATRWLGVSPLLARMETTEADGTVIGWDESGDGRPVLLVNGGTANAGVWSGVRALHRDGLGRRLSEGMESALFGPDGPHQRPQPRDARRPRMALINDSNHRLGNQGWRVSVGGAIIAAVVTMRSSMRGGGRCDIQTGDKRASQSSSRRLIDGDPL